MKRGKAANASCPDSPSRPSAVKNDARYAPGARPNANASPNSASISHTKAVPPITARPARLSGCRASKRRPHHQLNARISGTSIATAAMASIAGANHNVRIVPSAKAMANTPAE